MAHAWKACWVKALGGSNPPSSADEERARPQGGRVLHLLQCCGFGEEGWRSPPTESPILRQGEEASPCWAAPLLIGHGIARTRSLSQGGPPAHACAGIESPIP